MLHSCPAKTEYKPLVVACLLLSLTRLFPLHLFRLEDGYLEDREGRLKWSCRNSLYPSSPAAPFLGTGILQLWTVSLYWPCWCRTFRGWVLLHWEVRTSVAVMGLDIHIILWPLKESLQFQVLVLTTSFYEDCYLCYFFRLVFSLPSSPWCPLVVCWYQSWLLLRTSYPSQLLQLPSRL